MEAGSTADDVAPEQPFVGVLRRTDSVKMFAKCVAAGATSQRCLVT